MMDMRQAIASSLSQEDMLQEKEVEASKGLPAWSR